jgi:hypothetical protein
MDEGDLEPEQAATRADVDELGSLRGKPLELLADVVDLEGDVMHPRTALGEELPHRCVRTERGEQLHTPVADAERCGLDSLIGHELAVLELGAEKPLIGRNRSVEIIDRDAEVVNPPKHEGDANGA